MEPILQTLTDLNIHFELQEHKAIFSEKDSEDVEITLPGVEVKNLFDKTFAGKKVIVHPLRNTASVSIEFADLCRFMEHFGHAWKLGDVYKEEVSVILSSTLQSVHHSS